MIIETFELFSNAKINRSLDMQGRRAVGDSLVERGNADWEDPQTKTKLRIYKTTPEAFAKTLYEFAKNTARVGAEPSTLYELHSGEDAEGTELEGVDETVLFKAAKILEGQGKALVFDGDTSDVKFVKFI